MSYQWQRFQDPSWVDLTDSGRFSGTQTATLTIANLATSDDATFRCYMNNGYELETNSAPATLTVNLAPSISLQPTNTRAISGATAQFSVAATGKPAVTYQWAQNGVAIAGATSNPLVLTNVSESNEGSYAVLISNSAGATSSASATLFVDTAVEQLDSAIPQTNYIPMEGRHRNLGRISVPFAGTAVILKVINMLDDNERPIFVLERTSRSTHTKLVGEDMVLMTYNTWLAISQGSTVRCQITNYGSSSLISIGNNLPKALMTTIDGIYKVIFIKRTVNDTTVQGVLILNSLFNLIA